LDGDECGGREQVSCIGTGNIGAMKWKMLFSVKPRNYVIEEVNEVVDADGHTGRSHLDRVVVG
jgi:hypothetical protein